MSRIAIDSIMKAHSSKVLDINHLTYRDLKKGIRLLQKSLRPRQAKVIAFSTCSPTLKFGDHAFVMAALPFFARKHTNTQPITPFCISLHSNLELMAGGPTPLTVVSVHNVSTAYADHLEELSTSLERERDLQEALVAEGGMECWRETILFAAWEAALYRVGFLTRWEVLVQKA
jgi:hypothetical protein